MDINNGLGSGRINVKIRNLSNSTKEIMSKVEFFTFEVSLTFVSLRKILTKTLILHYFKSKHYFQIKFDIFDYVISRILIQLTSKTSLAD